MTLLVLAVMAIATTYVGTIAAAFSALMRLSLRLTVERHGRAAGLGPYLDDPVLLFVPLRLLLGLIIAVTAIFLATLTGVDDAKDPGVLLLSMAGFFLVWYVVYVLLSTYAVDFMSTKVWGNINVGLLLGLGQFVTTFAITGIYVRFANRELDPRAAALRAEMEASQGAKP